MIIAETSEARMQPANDGHSVPAEEGNHIGVSSPADRDWLLLQVRHVEREAYLAIDRLISTAPQATLLRSILSVSIGPGGLEGGACRTALQLPLLVHAAVREAVNDDVHLLCAALTLLESGIYTLDHIIDREIDGKLSGLPREAVLLGAVCMISHLPYQILLALHRDTSVVVQLARMLADGLERIGAGEFADISNTHLNLASSHAVEFAARMKTGERRAMFAGMAAVSAGATRVQIDAYEEFGRALGTARQLRSDLSDLFGEEASRDLRSGVLTLPLAISFDRANAERKRELTTLLDGQLEPEAVQRRISSYVRESGAMDEVVARIELLCQRALGQLEQARPFRRAARLLGDLVKGASPPSLARLT